MRERGRWAAVFLLAALFNYAIGFPTVLARRWSYDLAPALVDGVFVSLFIAFWISTARKPTPAVGTA